MSEFTDYFLEEIVANIKLEYNRKIAKEMTEDAYIIHRLSQVAHKIVSETRKPSDDWD
jgi:hypothetical protein